MPVTRRPFFAYWLEPHALHMEIALLFPVSASVRVPGQGLPEPIDGPLHLGGGPAALVWRKAYPSW
eukprot:10042343-Alexandrium_andersonii.AAC.1